MFDLVELNFHIIGHQQEKTELQLRNIKDMILNLIACIRMVCVM